MVQALLPDKSMEFTSITWDNYYQLHTEEEFETLEEKMEQEAQEKVKQLGLIQATTGLLVEETKESY